MNCNFLKKTHCGVFWGFGLALCGLQIAVFARSEIISARVPSIQTLSA
jgi:hypothetical protein